MNPITTSIFDLFKIGPGPSSSHTIAPMKICLHFKKFLEKLPKEQLNKATKIEVHLYGSLSATGKGHGTDKAVIAGLMGLSPETCDADELIKFFVDGSETYTVKIGAKEFLFDHRCIFYDQIQHFFAHKNTIIIKLMSDEGPILEKEYYSTGGGFYKVKGEDEEKNGFPRYPYSTLKEIKDILKKEHITIMQLCWEMKSQFQNGIKKQCFMSLIKLLVLWNSL